MQDIITNLREFSDRYHHPREDEAFRRLAKHCPDMESPLARLHQEHRVIANTGEKVLLQINAILEDVVVSREEVEMALATYLVYYENHIAKEEGDILARAARAPHGRGLECRPRCRARGARSRSSATGRSSVTRNCAATSGWKKPPSPAPRRLDAYRCPSTPGHPGARCAGVDLSQPMAVRG